MKLSAILFVLLITAGCKNVQNQTSTNSTWSLEIKKSGCMDVCDAYSFIINNNAEYKYKGLFKVTHIGKKSGILSQENMTQLEHQIKKMPWGDFKTSYGQPGTGPQRKELHFTNAHLNKQIVYYSLEPLEIRDLEKIINKIISHDSF